MSRRILIGRSVSQAGTLADLIARRGITGVYQELLAIESIPVSGDFEDRLSGAQAIIVTSANAVGRLSDLTRKRYIPLLAVGDGTARIARAFGFGDVTSAQGDAEALLELCRKRLKPELGRVLYVRGREVATDLAPTLSTEGYEVDSITVYATEPTPELRPQVEQQLRQARLEATILFSPRGAANFVSLVRQAGVDYACAGMTLIALSPAIATAASELIWRLKLVPEQPTIPALLSTLEHWRDGKFAG